MGVSVNSLNFMKPADSVISAYSDESVPETIL